MKKICSFLGDYYHNKKIIYDAIGNALTNVDNVLLASLELAEIQDAINEQKPELIIISLENRINPTDEVVDTWLTKDLDTLITNYVKDGGAIIVLHSALASYPHDSKFINMIKGHFVTHPNEHCMVRYTTNDNIPFTDKTGFDYEILDEHYFVEVNEDETNVFMKSFSKEHGEQIAGWFHDHGKGKVMCIAQTHNEEGYKHKDTIRLIERAVEYMLG